MIRSMYSAISGLRTHQTMLDVVGNNISNVNTTGFKSSSAAFTDVLSQTLAGGTAPAGGGLGGTNPAQIGLGTRLAGINTDFSQGSLQRSGRNTDMAIQGDGFFVVQQGGEQLYTRSGNFSMDAAGNLVTNEGAQVMGWPRVGNTVNTNGPVVPIRIETGTLLDPSPTGSVEMTGNLPATAEAGDQIRTSINVYDTQGNAVVLTMTYTKLADNSWSLQASRDGVDAFSTDPDERPVLTFADNGQLQPPTTVVIPGADVQVPMGPIDLNMGGVTQFGDSASILARSQDGAAAGSLESFSMGRDGLLTGTYSNGQTRPIGQIAMATFANPQGLEKLGGSSFRVGVNSGAPEVGIAGTGGRGILVQGAVEMSNVDLAGEFTNLIVAQRGFQANSRVITTSDELLQEVVNLKR